MPVLLLILFSQGLRAQDYLSDSITTPNKGHIFYQKGQWLGTKQLLELTKPYPEAYSEMLKAKADKDAATIIGLIGGFMVGWPIGAALAGGDPNWTIALIGGGAVLVSIPISNGYRKHALEATEIYNREAFKQASRKNTWEFRAGSQGIGLLLRF